MAITLYSFNSLDFEEQGNIVWDGQWLCKRNEEKYEIALYAVSDFYVEAYYNPVENRVEGFRAFKSATPLEPYLDQIDLSELDI